MKPQLMLIFLLGGAILLAWLLQTAENYWHRHRCSHCGSKAPRIIKLIQKNISSSTGYYGDEYQSICPICGDSYNFIIDL